MTLLPHQQANDFFVVWRHDGGSPTVRHPDYATAYAECKRLTREHKSKFHVLRVVCTMEPVDIRIDGPSIEEFNDRELPF